MKIAIIQGAFFPVPPILGGAVEKIWYQLGQHFAKQGHEVIHIGRSHSSLVNKEVSHGVTYLRTKGYKQPNSLLHLKLLDLFYSIRAIALAPDCDILVTNTFWLPLLTKIPLIGRLDLSNTKLYIHVARYPKKQFFLYKHADRIQPVSTVIKDAIVKQTPSIRHSVKVIPNPVPFSPIINNPRENRPNEILFVGRIHPEKGLDILIKSYALLPENLRKAWTLRIIGPHEASLGGGGNSYLATLKNLCDKYRIKAIWQGPIYKDDKLQSFLKNSSLFVYPSIAAKGEASPLAPLEAMASGCVPIVSDMQCFSDYITDKENGFMFKIDNRNPENALAEIIELLINNPTLINKARSQAIRTAKNFTVDRIAKLYLEDFEALLANYEQEI